MSALICIASVIFGAWLWWRFPIFYDVAGEGARLATTRKGEIFKSLLRAIQRASDSQKSDHHERLCRPAFCRRLNRSDDHSRGQVTWVL